jgi:hypothetical protein
MSRRLALLFALLALGCGKSEGKPDEARAHEREREHVDRPEHEESSRNLEDELRRVEDDEYEPTPLDLPLTTDFAKAAGKRVTAETYKNELARIERELAYESRSDTRR